jgi:hypothetical protein
LKEALEEAEERLTGKGKLMQRPPQLAASVVANPTVAIGALRFIAGPKPRALRLGPSCGAPISEVSGRRAPTEAAPSISPEHHHDQLDDASLYIRTSFSGRIDVC